MEYTEEACPPACQKRGISFRRPKFRYKYMPGDESEGAEDAGDSGNGRRRRADGTRRGIPSASGSSTTPSAVPSHSAPVTVLEEGGNAGTPPYRFQTKRG